MKISTSNNHMEGTMAVCAEVDPRDYLFQQMLPEMILRDVAKAIADRIVAEHFQEIISKIDMQAIANLVVAEAGAQINKTLKEKIPDKLIEIERTRREVWYRGVFGGVKRIG